MKQIALTACVLTLGLTACTDLSKTTCAEGNWQAIGQQDGLRGRDALFVNRHIETCGELGFSVNQALWEEGRQQGLRVFCTPQSQYERGRAGKPFNEICAVEELEQHKAAFDKGRKYFLLTQRIDRLRAKYHGYGYGYGYPFGNGFDGFMDRVLIDSLLRERRQYETY